MKTQMQQMHAGGKRSSSMRQQQAGASRGKRNAPRSARRKKSQKRDHKRTIVQALTYTCVEVEQILRPVAILFESVHIIIILHPAGGTNVNVVPLIVRVKSRDFTYGIHRRDS